MFIILEGAKDAFEVFFDNILLIWIDKESVCNFRENKNYILVLLAHMALCHHFASVIRICKLFIFSSSLNRFGPNLAEMFIGRSYTRIVILVQIGNPTWLPGPIMCSDWLKFWKSSCQKLLSRWNCNIIEMMTGWSSTKFVIFCADRKFKMAATGRLSLTLDPMVISFKDLFVRNYSTNWMFLNYLNVPWMVLYLIYYFGADRKSPRPIMYSDWVKLWRSF